MERGTIGIFIPNIHKGERHEYIEAVCSRAAEYGFKTMCFSSYTNLFLNDDSDKGEASVYYLAKMVELSGMVIFTELIKNDDVSRMLIERAKELGIPAFCVEKKFEDAYFIDFDYDEAFEAMTSHVIEKHNVKSLCMMSGIEGNEFSNTRNKAFRRALEKHGIEFDPSMIYYGEFWEMPTKKALEKLVAEREKLPEAIVCANDIMAITVCNFFEERGLRIPDDMIVTGFDGIDRASQNYPTITTAKYDYASAGRYIADVVKSVSDGEPPTPCDRIFKLDIMPGQSCGCVENSSRITGKITSHLYDVMVERQEFRLHMDHMTLSYNNGNGICEVMSAIGKYAVTTMYTGMAIYLDPSFFGNPTQARTDMVLAAYVDPDTLMYFAPFKEFEGGIYSKELLDRYSNLLFVPLHCQDRVYGYIAADYSKLETVAADRLSDFAVHLNMLLASVETSSKLSEMVKALNEMYVCDSLTNLLNRRGFYREVDDIVLKANESGENVMIVSVDLDGLKYINDTFGHSEGDFAIVAVADALKAVTAGRGICARFGGDEYLAALVGCADPAVFEKQFTAKLAEINAGSDKPYSVAASLGAEVISPEDALNHLQEAIKRADNKMFKCKKRSKLSRGLRFGR